MDTVLQEIELERQEIIMKLRFDNCPNCFANLNGRTVCSRCNTNINAIKTYESALDIFSVLKDRYLLGKVLGKGGFGITYLAQDIVTGNLCCIKEYLPSEFAKRSSDGAALLPREKGSKASHVYEHGRKRFIDEADTLIKLRDNKIVVNIVDFFEQNNTAYFVMEYLDGVSMKKLTAQHNGKLPYCVAKKIMEAVGVALIDVHEKEMLHRDISPENILITKNNEVKLIDFGAARDYIKAQNNGMSVVLKAGYAPPEQYSTNGSQGPWTDIYALAATFYTCVSGHKLLDSMFIMQGMAQPELVDLNCGVDKKTSDIIAKAMNINYRNRYQSIRQFLMELGTDIDRFSNCLITGTPEQDIEYEVSHTMSASGGRIAPDISYNPPITDDRSNRLPFIEVCSPTGAGRRVNVPQNYTVKVGRAGHCDVVINNDTVISREHILIAYDDGMNKFKVTDTSANGSYLPDGARMAKNVEMYIEPGTVIRLVNDRNMIIVKVE